MQCEDNSKMRIPLSEVCQTTDIGCVPETNGKPDCNPQPDELPIAFDPSTTTLWLFSCKTRDWVEFKKFTMCELSALNLDNITNICDILNIGVYFDAGSGCQQGTVTLGELAEKILDCLKLETKILTIGQGEGNKVKISIEGLPLDPVYVQGHNIWSEGGSGTEADPLVVATYDPICKWPTKTQAQVDAADTKHLGACLDGEMTRVPFPPKVCELPSRNQAQVDAAGNKELIACVNGEGVKIPYPSSPCTYPQLTPEQVERASDKDIIACVDGRNVKIPVPGNLYEESVCASDQITLEQAKQRGNNLTIVGCDTGRVVRIPVSQSGFFDRDYICVPEVSGVPSGVPAQGTGPLRVDCDGGLYVWLCDSNKWLRVRDGIEGLNQLNANNVPDICNNFRMKGWYSNNSDPCVQDVWLTLSQLANILAECGLATSNYVDVKINDTKQWVINNFTNDINAITSSYHICIGASNVSPGQIFRVRDLKFINFDNSLVSPQGEGSGGPYVRAASDQGTSWVAQVNLVNRGERDALGVIMVNGLLFTYKEKMECSLKMVISDTVDVSFADSFAGDADIPGTGDYPTNYALVSLPGFDNRSYYDEEGVLQIRAGVGGSLVHNMVIVPANSSVTRYIQGFFVINTRISGGVGFDFRTTVSHFLIR